MAKGGEASDHSRLRVSPTTSLTRHIVNPRQKQDSALFRHTHSHAFTPTSTHRMILSFTHTHTNILHQPLRISYKSTISMSCLRVSHDCAIARVHSNASRTLGIVLRFRFPRVPKWPTKRSCSLFLGSSHQPVISCVSHCQLAAFVFAHSLWVVDIQVSLAFLTECVHKLTLCCEYLHSLLERERESHRLSLAGVLAPNTNALVRSWWPQVLFLWANLFKACCPPSRAPRFRPFWYSHSNMCLLHGPTYIPLGFHHFNLTNKYIVQVWGLACHGFRCQQQVPLRYLYLRESMPQQMDGWMVELHFTITFINNQSVQFILSDKYLNIVMIQTRDSDIAIPLSLRQWLARWSVKVYRFACVSSEW